MSWPGSVVAGARRFVFLLGITATVKWSDVAAPLLHRMSPVVADSVAKVVGLLGEDCDRAFRRGG